MSVDGKQYFGGCEGGASHSKVVILDQDGKLLAQEEGEGTNQWIVGTESFLVFWAISGQCSHFIPPWNHLENLCFCGVFRGYKMRTLVRHGLTYSAVTWAPSIK